MASLIQLNYKTEDGYEILYTTGRIFIKAIQWVGTNTGAQYSLNFNLDVTVHNNFVQPKLIFAHGVNYESLASNSKGCFITFTSISDGLFLTSYAYGFIQDFILDDSVVGIKNVTYLNQMLELGIKKIASGENPAYQFTMKSNLSEPRFVLNSNLNGAGQSSLMVYYMA